MKSNLGNFIISKIKELQKESSDDFLLELKDLENSIGRKFEGCTCIKNILVDEQNEGMTSCNIRYVQIIETLKKEFKKNNYDEMPDYIIAFLILAIIKRYGKKIELTAINIYYIIFNLFNNILTEKDKTISDSLYKSKYRGYSAFYLNYKISIRVKKKLIKDGLILVKWKKPWVLTKKGKLYLSDFSYFLNLYENANVSMIQLFSGFIKYSTIKMKKKTQKKDLEKEEENQKKDIKVYSLINISGCTPKWIIGYILIIVLKELNKKVKTRELKKIINDVLSKELTTKDKSIKSEKDKITYVEYMIDSELQRLCEREYVIFDKGYIILTEKGKNINSQMIKDVYNVDIKCIENKELLNRVVFSVLKMKK